jgi:hypothetical protein
LAVGSSSFSPLDAIYLADQLEEACRQFNSLTKDPVSDLFDGCFQNEAE